MTVGELKEVLNNFNDDAKVLYTDGDVMPTMPVKFHFGTVADFVENNMHVELAGAMLADIEEDGSKPTDLVVFAVAD